MELISNRQRELCEQYLEGVRQRLETEDIHAHAEAILGEAGAVDAIATYVENHPVDLVAMTIHGSSGIGRWWMGSAQIESCTRSRVPCCLFGLSDQIDVEYVPGRFLLQHHRP